MLLWICRALKCFQDLLTNVRACYIHPQSSIVLNATFKLPLSFCVPSLGIVVGAKTIPRIIFLLLVMLSSWMPLIVLDKWKSIWHTSPRVQVWINYQKTKERRNLYSRMFSWAPLNSKILSGAQESNQCAINLDAKLSQVTF